MKKGMSWIGIAIAIGAFAFLIFREKAHHAVAGPVGGIIAACVIGGCILIAFSSGSKKEVQSSKAA